MNAVLEKSPECFSPGHLKHLSHETPYLLMDSSKVENRYQELSNAFPGIQLHYAMKCNPHPQVLRLLDSLGCRFEIASFPELEMLMAIGADPETVLFSNPVKPSSHIAAAFRAGLSRFAFDSVAELQKIAEHAPGSDVYIRLGTGSPCSEVPSEGKFGVGKAQAVDLMMAARQYGLNPSGIAFHVGSQMLSPRPWIDAIRESSDIMTALLAHGIRLELLDIGGGFPAHYGDFYPDFKDFGATINQAMAEYLPYAVKTVAEPGRALVAEAGVMVSTVIGIAERNGKSWLHLDVGAFNGMMEALETKNTLMFPLKDSKEGQCKLYNITGPSCDSQDTILYQVPLSENLAVGDQVYLYSTGAYTTSYASNFNGFSIPKIHWI